jgi:dolichol-phosphate mannosyltransferase
MTEISVVVPVYRAAECLDELHRRLTSALVSLGVEYEIILVDDGSGDASGEIIERIAAADPHVVALLLSRNFGQHPAITAGLAESRGRWVVVMDCDLQDPPEEIPRLYRKAVEGYDVVFARRIGRKDPLWKRITSAAWFRLFNALSESSADPAVGNFSVISRQVADEFLRISDVHRHYLIILRWLGFRQAFVDVEHAARFAGNSSYSLRKLMAHSLSGIASQSTNLLYVAIYVGFLFVGLSAVQIVYIVVQKLLYRIGVQGWASLMAVIWLVGGAILFSLGVLGIYLGKVFEQSKQRPLFIVRKRVKS